MTPRAENRRERERWQDGGPCPTCGGVLVGYRIGFLCLDCRNHWTLNIDIDADLSRPGFPVVRKGRS